MVQSIEAHTQEASDGLVKPGMTVETYRQLVFPENFGHPPGWSCLCGRAQSPVTLLAVTLHQIELEDWGWTDTDPGWAYLGDEVDELGLKTYIFGRRCCGYKIL